MTQTDSLRTKACVNRQAEDLIMLGGRKIPLDLRNVLITGLCVSSKIAGSDLKFLIVGLHLYYKTAELN